MWLDPLTPSTSETCTCARGWRSRDVTALQPDPGAPLEWDLDPPWARVIPLAKLPPWTEYTRTKRR